MRKVQIKDVGPIQDLVIPIPDGGGVVVLRGRNGEGKSHALEAVDTLLRGKGDIATRDGALGAIVEGFGARISVTRRQSRSGEIEVARIEGADPFLLVDPGIKEPAAAEAARQRQLLLLSGAGIELERFATLVGGMEQLEKIAKPATLKGGDVVTISKALKRDLQAQARLHEAEHEKAYTEARGLESSFKDIPEEQPAESIQQDYETALIELRGLEASKQDNEKNLGLAEKARTALADLGEVGTAVDIAGREEAVRLAREKWDAFDPQIEEVRSGCDLIIAEDQEAIRVIERRIAAKKAEAAEGIEKLREAQGVARSEAGRAEEALENSRTQARRRSAMQKALASAESITQVSQERIEEAKLRVEEMRKQLGQLQLFKRASEQREAAKLARERGTAEKQKAEDLRSAAQGCDRIVAEVLAKVCPDGMTIEEGYIRVATDRGRELFAELSHGERCSLALRIAAKAVGDDGVVVARQESWEAQDPHHRLQIAELCKELGVVMITAACDDGDLRVENFEPA